jgi:hypothetical protein
MNIKEPFCFLGFGCSSHVTTTTNINNTVIDQQDFNNTNKQLMEASVDVLLKNANKCSSSVNQNNSCTLNNLKASGPVVIGSGSSQTNKASVNFSCIQSTKASSEMATAMMQRVGSELDATNGANLANSVKAAVTNSTKSGFLGGAHSSTADNTNINNMSLTQIKQNVENIFEKNLKNNFSSETVNECIGKTEQSNKTSASDVLSGESITANCSQTNSVEQVSKCEQLNSAINKTLQETAQELGFKVATANETSTSNETKTEIKSETIGTGPIQDLTGLFNSFGAFLGLASLGLDGPYIMSCCVCCCCILLICFCSIIFASKGSSSSTPVLSTAGTTSTGIATNSLSGRLPVNSANLTTTNNQGGGFLFDISYSLLSDMFITSDS